MKSFVGFLTEGDQLKSLVNDFIKWGNSNEGEDEWGDTLNVLKSDPGSCAMVSETLISFLKKNGVHPKFVTGKTPINTDWLKHMTAEDEESHTAVLVGNTVIDLTSQQFDKSFPFPRIVPLSTFKKEWKKIT